MVRALFILLAFISVSAYATPKVGDYASYDILYSKGGSQYPMDYTQELLEFDPAGNRYLREETFTLPGLAPNVSQTWLPASNFITDETISSALSNCSAAGGRLQNITVPAGSFQTCAIPFIEEDRTGTIWIANAPFGFVRLDALYKKDKVLQNILLRSFR